MMLPLPSDIPPWGGFQNRFGHEGFFVKLIEVEPSHRLSLQRHFKREEFWIVVSGVGMFELDGVARKIGEGEMIHVGIEQTHRVANVGSEPLIILELQKGECREDDIERLEDDYKRA